jgi:hypothetical protein
MAHAMNDPIFPSLATVGIVNFESVPGRGRVAPAGGSWQNV